MLLPYRTHLCCAMTITSRLSTLPPARINSAGAMGNWAKVRMARRKSRRAFPLERGLWATAACFFSLLIRCNTEEASSNDPSNCSIRAAATAIDPVTGGDHFNWRNYCIPPHARGRLPRSLPTDGGGHYTMAGTRSRRGRTPSHGAHRSGDERRSEDVGNALDFSLWSLRRQNDV